MCALSAVACASGSYEAARRRDTEEAYLLLLASKPSERDAARARERLDTLHYQAAERSGDPAAFRRYLAEHADGAYKAEAAARLRVLRLRRALDAGNAATLQRFVELHGEEGGPELAEARRRIEAYAFETAVADSARPVEALREFLERHPAGAHRDRARAHYDEAAWAQAQRRGSEASLRRYLADLPEGTHRREALDRLEAVAARNALGSRDPAVLRAFLAEFPASAQTAAVRGRLSGLQIALALKAIDCVSLRSLVALGAADRGRVDPALVGEARALTEAPALCARAAPVVQSFVEATPLRSVEQVRVALEADDPLVRWSAVSEAALLDVPAVWDALVEHAPDAAPLVAISVRAALLGSRRGDAERERERREALEALRSRLAPRRVNPEDQLRLGLVLEALGNRRGARNAYRTAAAASGDRAPAAAAVAALSAREDADVEGEKEALAGFVREAGGRLRRLREAAESSAPEALRNASRMACAYARTLEILSSSAPSEERTAMDNLRREAELEWQRLEQMYRSSGGAAAQSLLSCGSDPLTSRAIDASRRRVSALDSLASLGDGRLAPALIAALDDPDPTVRAAAAQGLGRIGVGPARRRALEALLGRGAR